MVLKYNAHLQDAPAGHAFAATGGCEADNRLRKFGFRIAHRRKGQEPVWEHRVTGSWAEVGQTEAMAICDRREKAAARKTSVA